MLRGVSLKAAATAVTGVSCMSYYTLPDLKYPAELPKLSFDWHDGIKPVFSPRQVELHYTKHHKAYVDKLNSIGQGYEGKTIEDIVQDTNGRVDQKVIFNQAAQHFNHSFLWNCLTPNGKAIPKELEATVAKQFGSVADFKAAFEQAGAGNFGSGWTWLCVNPKTKELEIDNTSNAGCPITNGLRPIFTADVWEHAYYKDFENRRPDYLKEMWAVVNWEFVAQMYARATK
ncbi:iron superoxide dismutase (FESODA) [Leptomonas seymouri]|uniref:Superoxide dismutase n=1 Tax=Leptomonas seymouri TaxID=5684 RepID=A0A0N0P9F1_LEPSE|nr:iron superoxide dismutase (FESODA) [Leptomonas seymouri]|eukprot:KPI90647.1 iron superoxide dismutase (FESODA) [Leptomonas seymouri]